MHRATIEDPSLVSPRRPPVGLALIAAGHRPDPGVLAQALAWQGRHPCALLITDRPGQRQAVTEALLDALAAGIDPARTTICLRSHLPALAELAQFCLDFVTIARLERHRPAAEALRTLGFERALPAGLLAAPVQDAAAVIGFRATLLAADSAPDPLREQTNEIIRHLNAAIGTELLPAVRALPIAQGGAALPAACEAVRDRRADLARHPDDLRDILREGTSAAREITQDTRDAVASALGLFQL